jgi:hypothetical protein
MSIRRALTGILLVALTWATAATASPNEACQKCHGDKAIISQGGGHLYIDPGKFAGTSHEMIGCPSCHDAITAQHPHDGIRPPRAKCRECHADIQKEYSQSLHGGNANCSDCHNPHMARRQSAVSGDYINAQCNKCHDKAKTVATHGKWLPQAALHVDAMPCITCHTSSKNYTIIMYIETREPGNKRGEFHEATFADLMKVSGGKEPARLIDMNGDNQISLDELRRFNTSSKYEGMRLWGMMMPEQVTHSLQILDNRWDCTFCHVSGPRAAQSSYVAFPGKDGRYSRLPVEKGAVLDLLFGTPDFYMMGNTRSTALNIVGALILVGGMMFPIAHGSLRFLTRKNRKEH